MTTAGAEHAEPLLCDRMAVFQAGVADIVARPSGPACQLACHPGGVATGLAQAQEQVFPLALEGKAQLFDDDEIGGRRTNTALADRAAEGVRQIAPWIEGGLNQEASSSRATA